jgi:hypothetical protein
MALQADPNEFKKDAESKSGTKVIILQLGEQFRAE